MIYLASPYSDPSLVVREYRYIEAYRHSLLRMRQGISTFSPIVYGHQFADDYPSTAAAWLAFNQDMFASCDVMEVLMLEGWQQSIGVCLEIEWAAQRLKPVHYVEPHV